MSDSLLTLILFLGGAMAIAGVLLLVRDLVWGGSGAGNQPVGPPKLTLRRPTPKLRATGPLSFEESISQWFTRLTQEAALPFSAETTAMLVALGGIAPGAALYAWNEDWMASVMGLVIGMVSTLVALLWLRARRVNQVLSQLPHVVDQIARAVRAGKSLDQALEVVATGLKAPLGPELRDCCRRLRLGVSLSVALRLLQERVPLADVQLLVTTLDVYRDVGGQLASMLDHLAHMMRDRHDFRRQINAATAGGRLAATLLAIIAPGVFAYFYLFRTSSMVPVFSDPWGVGLLTAAAVLEIIGLIWVFRVARVRV